MIIYLGADHRGFAFKEELKKMLHAGGYEVVDKGNAVSDEKDDYPDFAAAVAREVSQTPKESKGILVCGSGAGMDMVANKFPRVRSVLAISKDQVRKACNDDDANVLTLAADVFSAPDAEDMVRIFLETNYAGEERHERRLEKLFKIEDELYKNY